VPFRYRHGDRPLEGYTILRGLGQGGFGEVYYARSDGGREVALKIIQQNHEIELRGVRQCMNLKSPYLVTIFDVHKDADGYPFVVMEHIRGPSLRDVVHAAPKGHDLAKAAYLVREIGKGLSYLHEHGIVHRDLKPENIFYEDGFVKIGDYGLSKYISVSHQSGQTISVGSVHYMAPEIGSGNYQRSIDIYALGVIFYELLTGTVPFNGDSMGEILMKHLSCEPDVSRIPVALQSVVQKALAKRPKDRYQSAEDFLDAVLAANGVAATLDGFDPDSVTSVTAREVPSLVSLPPEVSSPTQETRTPEETVPPPVAATAAEAVVPEPKPAVGAEPKQPGEASASSHQSNIFRRGDLDQRLFISFVTTVAMGLSVWLLAGSGMRTPIAATLLIAAGVIPILIVEGFLVPRFRLESGLTRSVASFVFAAVPITVACATVARHSPIAILAGLLLVDWTARLDPQRSERVSLSQALLAGLFGLVAGMATRANPASAGGVLAGMSLVLNAFAPFSPRRPQVAPQNPRPQAPPPPTPRQPEPQPKLNSLSKIGEAAANVGEAAASFAAQQASPVALAEPSAPAGDPGLVTPPSRLVRTRDAAIAGVCGGLAARYAVDVAWVRLAFFLFFFITAGCTLPAYIAMWVCMPKAGTLRKEPAPETSPRQTGGLTRVLCSIAAVAALAGGVPLLVTAVAGLIEGGRDTEEFAAMFGAGGFLILFASFSFVKGRSRHPLPLWRGTLQPLFVFATFSIASGLTVLAIFERLGSEDFAVAVGLACASGILATINGFGWFRWYRKRLLPSLANLGGGELRPYTAHPGWLALSTVFLALSFAVLGFGTLLALGASGPVSTPYGMFNVGLGHGGLVNSGEIGTVKFALLLFLPGLFSLVMARRPGGGAHVLRGALGAMAGGLLGLLLVTLLRESYHDTNQYRISFFGESMENMGFLIFLLVTGAVSAVLLAWPARLVPYYEPLLTVEKGARV
jgi:serine/threonine protein kinase/phage shock protein PspC (stress-responsive transcriptional regulator)